MKKILFPRLLLMLLFFPISLIIKAQNPTYLCELRNDAQTSSTVFEFDIYLLRTGSTSFEYAAGQFGILINPSIKNGGTITASIVAGSSDASLTATSQNPNTITFTDATNCIKIAGRIPPGPGLGAIISNISPGTRVCRVRLTNTVSYAQFQPNLTWTTNTIYPTQIAAYVSSTNTLITDYTSETIIHLANLILNPAPTVNPTATPNTVCAGSSVQLNAGVSGGSGSYTYTWTSAPVGFSSTLANPTDNPVSNITYNVSVFDGVNTVPGSVSVIVNALPAAPVVGTITQPTCGLATGSVVLSGLPSGTWTINPGGIAGSTSSTTISGLVANTYNFTVTNSLGCISPASANVVINAQPATPTAPVPGTITQPTCAVPTGSVVLSGLPSGNWTINPGSISGNTTTRTISGLAANTYNFTVTNASGCTSPASGNVVINAQPVTPTAPVVGTITQPTCAVPTGSVVLSGLPSGNWTVNPGSISGNTTTRTISGLAANTYNFTVTNASGCTSPASGNVVINTQPATPTTPVVGTITQPTCVLATGSVVLSGLPSGSWTINPGSIAGSTTITTISGLAANTYNFTVTNAAGCTSAATGNVVINTQPATPTAPVVGTITQSTCAVSTGSVVLSGLPSGSWTINPGGIAGSTTSTTISGLAANTYNFTVTNAAGCTSPSSGNVVINTAPSSPSAPLVGTITQPTCGLATGSVVLSGLPSGTWTINPGGIAGSTSSTTISGLAANTYNFTVTNSLGCISPASANVVINAQPVTPSAPVVGTITQPTCGLATGSVVLSGLPSGSWTINPGGIVGSGSSTTISGLGANTYNFTVTSAAGCTSPASGNVVINAQPVTPAAPVVGTITQPTCAVPTGSVVLSGLPAGSWTINPGAIAGSTTSTTVSGLAANTYNFTVTNAAGCTSPASANVVINTVPSAPAAPTVGTITQPTCALATGSVVLSGLPSGNWTINPGAIVGSTASTTISGLASNTYNFTVTNSLGCTSPASANVVINAQPVTPVVPAQTATISSGGTFIVTPVGGTIPAGTTYTWTAPTYTGGVTGGVAQGIPQANINGTLTIPSGTGTATYTVTPTSLAGCTGVTFTVTVTVTSTCVPVTVGTQPSSGTACATTGIGTFTVVAAGTGPFTYQWQYDNAGTWGNVVNGTPAGAVYTNAATAAMSVTGISTPVVYQYRCYITNCSGGNFVYSNAASLTVLGLPVPTLTSSDADNTFCLGTSVTFTATGGTNYDFRVQGITMQTGSSPTYVTTALANGQVVTVVATNASGCFATSPGISNFVNQPPYIIGIPTATCSTDYLTYTVGVTVSAGIVTCNIPTAVITNTGNTWSIAGIGQGIPVTLTITDLNGCIFTQPITAPNCNCPVVLPPVSGGDRSYCSGGTIPALTATVLAGETVDWYNTSSGGTPLRSASLTYTPTAPGQYYALARNTTSNCVSGTRTLITLTMNPLPTPTFTSSDADNIFCSGTSIIFTATGGTNYNYFVGGVSVQNGATATYTTTTLTNGQAVNVIVTNANGCTATAGPITNTVNPSPTPTLTSSDADNIFCAGTSIIFTAGGGATYDFRIGGVSVQTGSSTTFTTSTLTNGQIVTVIASNANGCTATSAAITNTVNPIPTPTLTSSAAGNVFCAGTSVTFTAGGGTNYNFRVGGVSVQNSTSNTYTTTSLTNGQVVDVIVSNSVGCALTSTAITNTVNPQPISNAGAGGDICGLSFNLNAHPSIGIGTWTKTTGAGTATFTPNASSPSATVTVSEYGTYTFTWTEVSGSCTSGSVATVNFYLQPVANAGTGGNNCGTGIRFNATLNAGIGTWTKVSGPGTVTFSPDANTANALATVSAFGTYTFNWSVNNGTCSNSATVSVVFIQQAAANAGSGGHSCDNTFTLGALVPATGTGTWTKSIGPGNATFTPDNHKANAKVTVDQFGAYTFAWTVVNSTCTSSDIVQVVFHNLPSINAGSDTALCRGGSIQLHAVGTGTVSWTPVALVNNPNIVNPVATPDTTTTFTVNLTDQYGCKNSDNIVVEVRDKTIADAGPDQTLGYLFTTTMNANLAHVYEKGIWSLLSGTGELADSTFAKTEVNSLSLGKNEFLWTVTNGYCPVAHDTVIIDVNDFVIPTLITPNMDGRNDYFVLRGLATLGQTELIIFDRRGAMVYKNKNYDNSWNGVDYNKNPLPDDTYFYVIRTSNGKSISGYIVIRR